MYQTNIDVSLTILALFLATNVVGASLNKNETSISKDATLRSVESSDHPNDGKLDFFKVVCNVFVTSNKNERDFAP